MPVPDIRKIIQQNIEGLRRINDRVLPVKVGRAVASGAADLGVVLCGTGIGISIAANKIKGIRCAHVTDAFQAEMCRQHNDANVLAMGGRITSPEDAYKFTKIFLTTPFAGGRHLRRVEKIAALEK